MFLIITITTIVIHEILSTLVCRNSNSSFYSPPVFNLLNQEKEAKKYLQHFLSFGPKFVVYMVIHA